MKKILTMVIVIIVGAITGHFLQGCSTIKEQPTDKISDIVILPTKPIPLVLRDVYYNVISQEGLNYICVNTKSYDDQIYNNTEVIRYIKQMKNENNALRQIINNK